MDLRNAISKSRLDELRPPPLARNFSWSDVASGSLSLGTCPAEHLVDKTVLEIQTGFDGSTQITVGDPIAQGRLMAISDNVPSKPNHYEVNNSWEYGSDTEIRIFFPSGTPSTGAGKVVVYLR